MSKNKFLIFTATIAVFAYHFSYDTKSTESKSISSKEAASDFSNGKKLKKKEYHQIQKLTGVTTTAITSNEEAIKSYNSGLATTLIGKITALKDLDEISYKWAAPKGTQIISGAEQQSLQDLKANIPMEFEITVIKHNSSKSNANNTSSAFFLHASKPNSHQLLGQSGYLNLKAKPTVNSATLSVKPAKKAPIDGMKIFH